MAGKRKKIDVRQQKKDDNVARIRSIVLELDKDIITGRTVKFIDEQLELHRTWGKLVPIKVRHGLIVREKQLSALLQTVDRSG